MSEVINLMGPPRQHVPRPSDWAARTMFSPRRPQSTCPEPSVGEAMNMTAGALRNMFLNPGCEARVVSAAM